MDSESTIVAVLSWAWLYEQARRQAFSLTGGRGSLTLDDLTQIGVIAAWKEAPDPDGARLNPGYAHRVMRFRMIDALRRQRPTVSLTVLALQNEQAIRGQSASWEPIEIHAGPEQIYDTHYDLVLALAHLTKRELLIELLSASGYNQREISKRLGLSEGRISQIRSIAHTRLVREGD